MENDFGLYSAISDCMINFNQPQYELDSVRFCPYTGPYARQALHNYGIQSNFEKVQPLAPLDLSITKLADSKDDDDSNADLQNVKPLEMKTLNQAEKFEDGNNSITNGKVLCDICNKEYSSKKNLKRHKVQMHEDTPYKCDFCDKSFRKLQLLRKHKIIDHPRESFQCDVCRKTFSVKQHLKSHQLIAHSESRQFPCEACGKSFKTQWNLQRHRLLHEEDGSGNCKVCGKDLKDEASSKREGRGSLVCDVCAESGNQTVDSALENADAQEVEADESE